MFSNTSSSAAAQSAGIATTHRPPSTVTAALITPYNISFVVFSSNLSQSKKIFLIRFWHWYSSHLPDTFMVKLKVAKSFFSSLSVFHFVDARL